MATREYRKGLKLKSLTIPEKAKVLDAIDAGVGMRKVCARFDIKPSTFYDIKKGREKIRKKAASLEDVANAKKVPKRFKAAKFADLDAAVYKWYKQLRSGGIAVRGRDIQDAAVRFAKHMGVQEFHASAGWLFNFRSRHCLGDRRKAGEAASADDAAVEPFRKRLLKIVDDSNLLQSQIYNADETGLFWRATPSNTQAHRHEKDVPGRKVAKDRISVLACGNADGSHRLTPMVVGKSKKPRALKNLAQPPCHYTGNKTAWFTQEIFTRWFHDHFVPLVVKFQREELGISAENVKAILLLDNAPAHPAINELIGLQGRIKVIYLPPNTTSLIQPMDQGVIEACKRGYRLRFQRECNVVIETEEDEEEDTRAERTLANYKAYNIRKALENWLDAWKSLKVSTLSNAWNKLLKGTEIEVDFVGFSPTDFVEEFRRFGEMEVTEENVVEWLECDREDPGYRHETEEDIVNSIQGGGEEDEEEEDEEETNERPKLSELRHYLDKALNIIEYYADLDYCYSTIRDIRSDVIKRQHQNVKQGKISDFFKPVPPGKRMKTTSHSSFSSDTSLVIAEGVWSSSEDGSGPSGLCGTRTAPGVMPIASDSD